MPHYKSFSPRLVLCIQYLNSQEGSSASANITLLTFKCVYYLNLFLFHCITIIPSLPNPLFSPLISLCLTVHIFKYNINNIPLLLCLHWVCLNNPFPIRWTHYTIITRQFQTSPHHNYWSNTTLPFHRVCVNTASRDMSNSVLVINTFATAYDVS